MAGDGQGAPVSLAGSMATLVAQRKIEAFHLNVFVGEDPLTDYTLLGPLLLEQSPHQLRAQSRQLAFHFQEESELISGLSYEGDPDAEALLYDMESGQERLTAKRRSEIVATRTHFAIDISARVIAFEYNQRGTKIADLEDLLQLRTAAQLGSEEEVHVSIVPVPGRRFLAELEEFERIQSAKAVLVRPNVNWLDSKSPLLGYADSSNAQSMTIEAKAGRAAGLSRRTGIVDDVKQVVRRGVTTLRQVVFWGTKDGRRQDLKLTSQIRKTVVQLRRMDDGQPDRSAMRYYVLQFCKEVSHAQPAGTQIE